MTTEAGFAEVDKLAGAGRLPEAAQQLEALLRQAEPAGGQAVAQWLKLAGLRRALRQPHRALDAVHRALQIAPLDFVALVMRAGLLERLNDAGAGEAWAEAIAQKPDGTLPPPLAAALSAGEAFHAAWQETREARLAAAAADAAAHADEDENWRIARFRDNVLRKTRVYHSQPTHFHYPGIVEREFHPRSTTPWLAELEAGFEAIRAEMLALLQSERAELEPYIQYEDREALAQWRSLNRNKDWSAIHLLKQGVEVAENAAQAPRTMEILSRVPQPRVPGASPNAMFSLLAPRTAIPPHVGVDNTRLVCHLPLVVPDGCWFRVGAETRLWKEGEAFAFDDTMEHEAMNPSDALRVVLIFDAWHPGLSEVERAAVAAMIGSEGMSGARD
ncbi:aspartyl/asparaginyl beta-hydroxylase domain-containing protein [Novosphingobium mangrovi (ex Huang et al. 2023)]|uniref:Aspartyl/asparaginyl beta-hydroxylase domain-containing protein n=1 Tax=Novosphingobium mangrovi (ex Huang et al. 2023) TaxID=2976432 RepID=A0ABT2I545_9SPHN|nr:aspartyl/asparaginyl beta-hydroxylase domain-containing protein [Novosphingobium mangrovi (ex Huang et al. 2023)]MCT2399672.1 aspartyl/asparaginyl beta-hydroxylase domain-containing protein [Novosphingobium mangrovi (ex Huang et al. 2023)]